MRGEGPYKAIAMIVRADHVAGAAFIALGILVFALGSDLPFGTVTQPGAGMMPKLVAGLMILFAVGDYCQGLNAPKVPSSFPQNLNFFHVRS